MKSGSKLAAGKAKERTQKKSPTRVKSGEASKSSRAYDARTLKLLWGRSAGRCAMPDCRIELFVAEPGYDPICVIGEMGHVVGSSDAGPRADPDTELAARDQYENLILLCRNCHRKIDGLYVAYPNERLREIKANHEAWVRTALPERGFSTRKWRVLHLQGGIPFDASTIGEALSPDQAADETQITVTPTGASWESIQKQLRDRIEALLSGQDPVASRIAVFPLAPVSACLYSGFLLTNRLNVRAFQYHRDEATWSWTKPGELLTNPTFLNSLESPLPDAELIFLFQLTSPIDSSLLRADLGGKHATYECSVPNPSTGWLQSKTQLDELARKSREMFESASIKYPQSGRWHVLYAGPAPGAIVVGQQLNPTMIPLVQLYEFQRPNHIASILIDAGDSPLTRWTKR
jgi:hypothetical protein